MLYSLPCDEVTCCCRVTSQLQDSKATIDIAGKPAKIRPRTILSLLSWLSVHAFKNMPFD